MASHGGQDAASAPPIEAAPPRNPNIEPDSHSYGNTNGYRDDRANGHT